MFFLHKSFVSAFATKKWLSAMTADSQTNKGSCLVATATAAVVCRTVAIITTVSAARSVVAEEGDKDNSDDDQPKSGIIE